MHIHTVLHSCTVILAQQIDLDSKGIVGRWTKFNLASLVKTHQVKKKSTFLNVLLNASQASQTLFVTELVDGF